MVNNINQIDKIPSLGRQIRTNYGSEGGMMISSKESSPTHTHTYILLRVERAASTESQKRGCCRYLLMGTRLCHGNPCCVKALYTRFLVLLSYVVHFWFSAGKKSSYKSRKSFEIGFK